jgi:hypothetical protein
MICDLQIICDCYIIPATIPKWSKFTIFIADVGFFMVFTVGLLEKVIIP